MTPHRQNPETPIMSDKSDNISDKSLHGGAALKPCPFCGCEVEKVMPNCSGDSEYIRHLRGFGSVQCPVEFSAFTLDSGDAMVAAWNTRTIARQTLRADITARYENTLRSLDDAPKVEQCDRELVARVGRFDEEGKRQVLAGEWDHTTLVNVVVKFRIAAARAAALSDLAALDGETM